MKENSQHKKPYTIALIDNHGPNNVANALGAILRKSQRADFAVAFISERGLLFPVSTSWTEWSN
jgi:HKD family nuclease